MKKLIPDAFFSKIRQIKDTEKLEGQAWGDGATEKSHLRLFYYQPPREWTNIIYDPYLRPEKSDSIEE